jgi:hypothetical protein
MRQYVGRIAAHADPEIEGSEALVAKLLRPLHKWHLMNPLRQPEHEYGTVEVTRI